jgi:hypothetical protein
MRTIRLAALLTAVPCLLGEPAIAEPAAEPETRGSEVITIEGRIPPKVPPKPKQRKRVAPKYSEAMVETNAWEVAWLLLDIDPTGAVTRFKFLRRPEHDLLGIAAETALALKFEPARDDNGAPVRTYALWQLEWPSYWWLVSRTGFATGIPSAVLWQRCAGDGPQNLDYFAKAMRNCAQPDFSADHQRREPWIDSADDVAAPR